MFTFDRSSGQMRHDGVLIGLGYSGHGVAANDPTREREKNVGPLPAGLYTIRRDDVARLGPIDFDLIPATENEMYGRDGFKIHWDTAAHDFTASDGCIVFWFMQVFQIIATAVAAHDDQLRVL